MQRLNVDSEMCMDESRVHKYEFDQDNEIGKKSRLHFWRQLQLTLAYMFDTTSGGFLAGYTATLIPELLAKDSVIQVDKNQASWIAAAAALPMAPACLLGGYLLESLGRKRAFAFTTCLVTIGWLCVALAQHYAIIIVGRFIAGIANGLAGTIAPIYIGEMSSPIYRGVFIAVSPLGLAIGPLLSHIISLFTDWQTAARIYCVISLIPFFMLLNLADSHVWLLRRGRVDEARRAFYWFRGRDASADEELRKTLEDKPKERVGRKDLLCKKFLKPLLVSNILFCTIQWSGNKTVLFYSIDILKIIIPNVNELLATILLDVIRIVTALAACFIAKRCFVRFLGMFSGFGTALSLLLLSLTIYLSQLYPESNTFPIISLLSMLSFLSFVSVGLNPLPWIIYSEIFPPNTKGVGGAFSVIMYFFNYFVVVKISPDLFELGGMSGTFCVFGTITLVFTVILYFILPETKGRTLKDIEEFFEPPRCRN